MTVPQTKEPCSANPKTDSPSAPWSGRPCTAGEPSAPFRCRLMTKERLARLYFPESTRTAAKQHLRRWIERCRPLADELRHLGYNPFRHSFLKPEVEAIVRHLGEPW